ncbi:MAG TPA: response regulator transcription factor [Longimicrobiales bacterium]|nr:response regulator transcription factor [Longimicrobiales bacterium]
MARLVVADDRALVREGIRRVLADFPDLFVIAETTTGIDLLQTATDLTADVVLLGVVDDWARIVALIPALRRSGLHVLLLATDPDPRYVGRAMTAGATGAVTTDVSPDELADALRRVTSGRPPRKGRQSATVRPDRTARPLPELSDREFEVMRLLGSGRSVNDIADRLGISPKTVGTYRGRVMDKLGLDRTVDLVRFVLERGLAE